MAKVFKVSAKLQIFDMFAPWMYIPIPNEKVPNVRPGGWGSIPVIATIGKTTWKTSLFPTKEVGYFLPVKKSVAKKESLTVGKLVKATFSLA